MQARLRAAPVRPAIPLDEEPDERLVDLVRGGDEAAFDEIVARYRAPLLAHCRPLLGRERAEDAVQETFMNAYRALREGDADIHLRPWLYRIAHNAAIDVLRRRVDFEPLSEDHDGVERPDQAAERSERLRNVIGAVRALPQRQRDAIVLRELEGRSYEEIAAELDVHGGAVRQLIHRARVRVRAAASALLPPWLVTRLPGAGRPAASDAAELAAGAGATATAAKVVATVAVTGAVAAVGALELPAGDEGSRDPQAESGGQAGGDPAAGGPLDIASVFGGVADLARDAARRGRAAVGLGGRRARLLGDDRSGRRAGDAGERDRSGSGAGFGDSDADRSGSGSGDGDGDGDEDRSGSNSGSGSGDGDGHSGSGGGDSSGPGSGGSLESDSGSGTSGSGHSGSGSSGSGSSGSGSSGSGSG